MPTGERDRSAHEYHAMVDRHHSVGTVRKRPKQAVMHRAALVVLVMDTGMIVSGRAPGVACGKFHRRGEGVGVLVLVHGIDVNQRDHAPDLRDQEQAKQPWTKALKPPEHCPNAPASTERGPTTAFLLRRARRVNQLGGPRSKFATMSPFRNNSYVLGKGHLSAKDHTRKGSHREFHVHVSINRGPNGTRRGRSALCLTGHGFWLNLSSSGEHLLGPTDMLAKSSFDLESSEIG